MVCLQGYRINAKAHYVTQLKLASTEKSAIKALDQRLPFDIEDLAIAAGIESTIPSRHASHAFEKSTHI